MPSIHYAAHVSNTEPPHPTTHHPRRRPRPSHRPLDGPLSDLRRNQLVLHLHRLGPRPVSEYLKELVGTDAGLQADALFLLEKYGALDPEIVRALDGDNFPPTVFVVGPR